MKWLFKCNTSKKKISLSIDLFWQLKKKTNDPIKGNASSSSQHWFVKSSNAQKQPKNKTSHAQNLICCIRKNGTNFPVQTENERNKSPSIFPLDTPDEWTPIPRKLLCLWAARPSHEKPAENMPYSFFRSSFHLFSLHSLYFRAVISLSPTHKSRSTDDFSCQSNFAVEAQWCFTAMQRKTTKMHSHHFLVGSVAPTEFFFRWETGHKCTFSIEISSVRLWFFDQSEFEEKSNSINRLLCHWKRWTSKYWSQWKCFPTEQIVLSMEKWSRIWNFLLFLSCRQQKTFIPTTMPFVLLPSSTFVWAWKQVTSAFYHWK